jgi:hypothetical protein
MGGHRGWWQADDGVGRLETGGSVAASTAARDPLDPQDVLRRVMCDRLDACRLRDGGNARISRCPGEAPADGEAGQHVVWTSGSRAAGQIPEGPRLSLEVMGW